MAAMRGRRQVDEELEGLALDEEAEYQRFLQVREGGEGCEWGASHRMPRRRARGQAEAALLPVSGKLSRHNMSLAGRRGLALRRVPARLPVPQSLRGGEGGEDAPLGFLEDDGEDSGGAALAWLGRFWAGGAAASARTLYSACRWLSGQLCTAAMHPSACRCRYFAADDGDFFQELRGMLGMAEAAQEGPGGGGGPRRRRKTTEVGEAGPSNTAMPFGGGVPAFQPATSRVTPASAHPACSHTVPPPRPPTRLPAAPATPARAAAGSLDAQRSGGADDRERGGPARAPPAPACAQA
jgi:hypothetical protein